MDSKIDRIFYKLVQQRWIIDERDLSAMAFGTGQQPRSPSAVCWRSLTQHPAFRLWVIFGYGVLAFSTYSICVAHLMDRLKPDEKLGASSRFLLICGLGAAVGPALAGLAMQQFGPEAMFALFAAVQGLLVLFILWRMRMRSTGAHPSDHFLPMLRTTPAAIELLPDETETE